MAQVPRRWVWVFGALLFATVATTGYALRHLHDDARRDAARLMACPFDDVRAEPLGDGSGRYLVEGCDGGGIMTCTPDQPMCFILPEAL